MRARASALARGGGLPDEARTQVQAALGAYADAISALQEASTADEVRGLSPRMRAGMAALAAAGRATGAPWADSDDPFSGLCGADPAHGPAEGEGLREPGGAVVPLCARCAAAAERGDAVPVRMVPSGGRPVPFTETAGVLREEPVEA